MDSPSQPPASTSQSRFVFKIAIVATMGALAFGYDTGVISGALPFMSLPPAQGGLGLTPVTEGLVTSALVFGAVFGSLLGGHSADKYGRRKTLMILSLFFMVGVIGTTLAPSVAIMTLMRFILGTAVGGASTVVPVYLAEMAGPGRRARLVSQNELMIVGGQLIAYVSNAILAHLLHSPHVWRYMLVIAAVPALLLGIGLLFVPASPRWLAKQGRVDEARDVLKQIRSSKEEVRSEVKEIVRQNELDQEQISLRAALKEEWVRKLLWIGVGLGFVLQFSGVNAFMYFTPTILRSTGLGTDAAITATIGNGVVAVSATLVALYLIGKHGRRPMLITGVSAVILTQLALGAVMLWMPVTMLRSYISLGCILVFLLFMQMLISPVYWLLMSELFPMRVRGVLTGVAICAQWIFNALVAFLFPIALAALGSATFFLFAAINVLSLIFVIRFLPETEGRSLEQLEIYLKKRFSTASGTEPKASLRT